MLSTHAMHRSISQLIWPCSHASFGACRCLATIAHRQCTPGDDVPTHPPSSLFAVSLNLFASRMEEVRGPLLQRLQTLLATCGGAIGALAAYAEAHAFMAAAEAAAQQAHARAAEAGAQLLQATQGEAEAVQAAADAQKQEAALLADAQRLASMAAAALSECQMWASRHAETLTALGQGQPPPQLTAPSDSWSVSACQVVLFLLPPSEEALGAGSLSSSGIITSALGTTSALGMIPLQQLQQAAALDARGRELLLQWEETLTAAMTSLLQYGRVLKELLPGKAAGEGAV